jgi:Protein of unknown function (DUF3152)
LLSALVVVVVGLGAVVVGARSGDGSAAAFGDPAASPLVTLSASPSLSPSPSESPSPSPTGPPAEMIPADFPHSGPATWRYEPSAGAVLGSAGSVRTFHLAVESNVDSVDIDRVAEKIDQTLGDPRSWIAGGRIRFQRVPVESPATFTIYLATAQTTRSMCNSGGVTGTGGYTSCRYTSHVVLNLDRWYRSIPDYVKAGVDLDTYRTYMINHEVGHQVGNGHELCPGAGKPAPVMEQQTLGLHGCTPNPWPYIDGRIYRGPSGHY